MKRSLTHSLKIKFVFSRLFALLVIVCLLLQVKDISPAQASPAFQAPSGLLQFPICGTWQISGDYGTHQANAATYPQFAQWSNYALDFVNVDGATWDAPVYAAHDGTIIRNKTGSGGSNDVVIRTADGQYASIYSHLNAWKYPNGVGAAENALVGSTVKAGDLVGIAGSTGTGGAHLHFAFGPTYGAGDFMWTSVAPEPMSGQTGFARWQTVTRNCNAVASTEVIVEQPNLLLPVYNAPSCPPAPSGTWTGWVQWTNNRGFPAYLTLTAANSSQSTNSGRYTPNLPKPGTYRVYAHNPIHSLVNWPCLGQTPQEDTANAQYLVHSLSGNATVSRNQQTSGEWVDLGVYPFGAGTLGYVELSDLTGEALGSKYVSFSAMRFVFVSDIVPTSVSIAGNAGVAGVILRYTDGTAKTVTADASGNYTLPVTSNWSGVITPSLAGYTFAPANKLYSNITVNQTAQNYTATSAAPTCTPGNQVDSTFFRDVLVIMNIPVTQFALDAFAKWMPYENTGACWNPLATTKSIIADDPSCTETNYNGVGVKSYSSKSCGVLATAFTLRYGGSGSNYFYTPINDMLSGQSFNWQAIHDSLLKWIGSDAYSTSLANEWQTLWNAKGGTDSAVWVGQSNYLTLSPGSPFSIYFDIVNNGTTTWTPRSYWLQVVGNIALGASAQQPITTSVAPGQTYRFTIPMTAPLTNGAYRTEWTMTKNGAGIGPPYAMYIDVTVVNPCASVTEIPQTECNALVTLYSNTNGTNWTNHTGWLQTTTPCTWYGITCTAGHVTKVLLFKNNLVGNIPSTIGNLSSLTNISFSTNQLSGNIPSTIGNLSNLVTINFSLNQLSGNIPSELGKLSQLTILGLGTNQLSGNIPTELGNLSQLTELWLDTNLLTGSIPPSLGNLSQLKKLVLALNQLSGSIPWQLGNLSKLQYLYLYQNQLTGSIPNSLGSLSQLTELHLGANKLTGSIPPELGSLSNLTRLALCDNLLTGNIPPELGNLSNLTNLDICVNQLTGAIPAEIGNLSKLNYLVLGRNHLSGGIPTWISRLTNLTGVWLDNNLLTGSIPSQIGNLTNLTTLTLDHNKLSGVFPTSISNLVNLTSLTFDCGLTSTNASVIAFIESKSPGWQNGTCPVVSSIIRGNPSPNSSSSVDFTVTFSEPVTGVDVSDFNLTTTGVSGVAVSEVSGSGSNYTVTVFTGTGNGTIRLNVLNDGTIMDAYLNSLETGFTSGEIYTIIKSATFTDTPLTYWANNYIERLSNAGITGGCGTGIYCPDSTVTRAQMAIFLLKGMHGSNYSPPSINGSTGFTDVATDYWAAAWIKQLAADGITGGCGGGNYCPDATVTRAQMAIFLLKAKHGSSYSPSNATGVFADVSVGYWADKWIEQLASEGVTSGCGTGVYCPDDSVTRAQMAVFLVKAFGLP